MHRLALLAVLLMLVAPLLSRALQALPPLDQPMCSTGSQSPAEQPDASSAEHALHAGMAGHAAGPSMSGDDSRIGAHATHEYACDYCVLAARLLPWLVAVLLLWPLLHAAVPRPCLTWAVLLPSRWPAHSARGPPLVA